MTPWETMILLVLATHVGFKALTYRRLAFGRAMGYLALWPGMNPRPFTETRPPDGIRVMAWGAAKMAAGAALILARTGRAEIDLLLVFIGIGLLVHFGLCDVLAGFWRLRGVAVERLFINPAASRTLGEFWGKRWNMAFHAVVTLRVFKPVARRWGTAWGVMATFGFSGLLHDLLISLPARAGWGLPTAYFVLQGVLVLAERRWRIEGRLWTLFWILAPAPLLFHPGFIKAILVPLL